MQSVKYLLKKGLNKLNEIKNVEIIKYKKCTLKQKELLSLLNDLLDTILIDKPLMSSKDENENEKKHKNENDKTLMLANEDDDEITKILMYFDEYAETMNQNEKNIIIKKLNDHLDETIDKSKSFGDQIKSMRKLENLNEYRFIDDYGDKELKLKFFKLKLAHLSNIIHEKLFEQIFGHKFETLADKLINTTNKEENQIIIKNIEKNKDKIFKEDKFYDPTPKMF